VYFFNLLFSNTERILVMAHTGKCSYYFGFLDHYQTILICTLGSGLRNRNILVVLNDGALTMEARAFAKPRDNSPTLGGEK
jgi:hypothetical protein